MVRRGKNRPIYLYDSVEVEALAERRLDRPNYSDPRKNLRAWGSRAHKRELAPMDWWITC